MRKEDRTEIEKLYQQLGIQNVDKVNTKLSTCRVTGHFSTKVTVSNQTPRDTPQPGQSDQTRSRSGVLIGVMRDVLRFGADMGGHTATVPVKDATTIPHRIDRKRWKKLMEKKYALGIKSVGHSM